jgi:hypothetical protein
MKKIFLVLISLFFVSCNDSTLVRYEVTVEVHYPTRVDTVKVVGDFYDIPRVESSRGTNYIYTDGDYVGKTCIETSAPINIIEYKPIQYGVKPVY